jgi:flagellar basal-body rod protein FlgB
MISQVSQIFSGSTLNSLKITLDAAAMRHQALASNVANINTPGYRRVDISDEFKKNFASALQQLDAGTPAKKVNLERADITLDHTPRNARMDGNNVNMEQETAEIIKNETDFDFAARMLSMNYQGLKSAITGRS